MRATARLRVEAPCRIVELTSAPPFSLRPDRAGTVWLVGSAAGPLGGDELTLQIEVGAGARIAVRSVAAQIALPGPTGAPAYVRIEATVAPGGRLDWCPEPTVVAARADLRQHATLAIADGGSARWRESVVLGRHAEPPGRVTARLDADLAGRPLLRHELVAGEGAPPGWDGPAGLAGARIVTAELVVPKPVTLPPVTLPLDGDGALTLTASMV